MLWVFRGGVGFVWWDFLEVTCHCPVIRMLLQEMGDLRRGDSYHTLKILLVKEMGKK